MKYRRPISLLRIVLGSGFFLVMAGCAEENKHAEGKRLAQTNCASCHLFPDPEILPRRIWGEKIIPNMGLLMGMSHGPIYSYGDSLITKDLDPTMSQEDWDKIVHYYLNESKNSIPKYPSEVYEYSDLFEPHMFSIDSLSVVSMTSYDEETGNLLLGNGITSELLTLNIDGEVLNSEKLETPPVKILLKDSLEYVLTIGDINPSDEAEGKLKFGDHVIEGLTRPVEFLIKDVDLDGDDDIFVCNYGNNVGDFSLFENQGNGSYAKKVIHPMSGAIKVEVANMDRDRENELVVLFAQEHETIMIWDYENVFSSGKKVIQFQPAFGSVDFQLRDMNGDGLKDIVIGNGDNADLSPVLKNFHGIRILLNQGNKEFVESHFYSQHGVSKIRAEDFDLDGDTDILAIANFGDFSDSKFKSVLLLMNEGDMLFKPKAINGLPNFRWQTVDVSDYDKDGDLDVFLGSFKINIGPKESDISDRKSISWVKLENRTN